MPNGYALICVQTPPFFLPRMCARMGNPPNYTHPVSLGDIPRGPNVVPGTSTGLHGGCRGVQLKARAMSTSVRKRQPNHPGRKGQGGLADSFSLKEKKIFLIPLKKTSPQVRGSLGPTKNRTGPGLAISCCQVPQVPVPGARAERTATPQR